MDNSTKRPWKLLKKKMVDGNIYNQIVNEEGEVVMCAGLTHIKKEADNARLIVKACNNYDINKQFMESQSSIIENMMTRENELVDILKTILGQIDEGLPFASTSDNEKLLKQAIAKAEKE